MTLLVLLLDGSSPTRQRRPEPLGSTEERGGVSSLPPFFPDDLSLFEIEIIPEEFEVSAHGAPYITAARAQQGIPFPANLSYRCG